MKPGLPRPLLLALAPLAGMCLLHARPADPARLAERALLLDVARAGERVVAVGQRGIIVFSDDGAATWAQASSPTQELLTAVGFATPRIGWAAGHGGIVLRSEDGGATWGAATAPATEDDSFLDLLALGPDHVVAVGAYGLYWETRDAGASWARREPPSGDMHLNRLARGASGALLLAGEAGTLARSDDLGASWTLLDPPYEGSFYGLHELASGRLLAHGLRGHVFVSDDDGASWTDASVARPALLMTALEVRPGLVLLASTGGHLHSSRDGGSTFRLESDLALDATAELLALAPDRLLAVGEYGIRVVPLP